MPEIGATEELRPRAGRHLVTHASSLLLVAVCGLSFALLVIGFAYTTIANPGGARDFTVYWATGRQLVRHGNPYLGQELLRTERAIGLPHRYGPMYMRNTPDALLLAYPLGLLGYRAASCLWSMELAASFVISIYLLWILYGRPKGNRLWIGYSFAPALIGLLNGQSAIFPLLGLVLFLRWHRTRLFLAGMSLWLCTLKPHLFVPFGLVLLVWIVISKSYKVLAGTATAIAMSCAVTWFMDPSAWSQYFRMMRTSGVPHEFIPCIALLMQTWFPPHAIWQRYALVVLASVWGLGYYWKNHGSWDWTFQGNLLVLVSLVVAPYSWLFDQAIAIPALLYGAYTTRSRKLLVLLALLSVVVEVTLLYKLGNPSAFYYLTMWSAPAWLAWYLIATKCSESPSTAVDQSWGVHR